MSNLKDGSYFPEWMVLRLQAKHIWLFLENHPGPDDIGDRARSVGTFFHEWIHHYHNISTVSGILSFSTTLSLWQSFRWTVVEPFRSAGSGIESLPSAHRLEITRTSQYYNFLHNKRVCNEILNKSAGSAGFAIFSDQAAVKLVPATRLPTFPGQAQAEVFHVIRCEARRLKPGSTTNVENVTVEIGPQEIMEGITSTLEQNMVSRISPNSTVETMKFAPYKLLERVAQHFVPDISSDLIVACGVASLQFADPPTMLLDILRTISTAPEELRMNIVKTKASELLTAQSDFIELHLASLDKHFPVEEPMGEVVKWITSEMRHRVAERRNDPFPEFTLLDGIGDDIPNVLRTLQSKSSMLLFIMKGKESPAFVHELRPSYSGKNEAAFQFGRLKFWAALHYLNKHLADGYIRKTDDIPAGTPMACPLLQYCEQPPRLRNDESCTNAPWRVGKGKSLASAFCAYSAAEIASRHSAAD